ncbi:MAG: hypothetical protein HFJ07_01300 [Lachnospiraceae bacterium]|nr:hypothetical protein [Lachnospiraceae bacterium]
MELKSILKKCMLDFLVIQAGITLAMGIIGCINPPSYGVSHYLFFMPFVYAFFCVIPSFVVYSTRELSIKEMLVRKVIHFFLIEVIVMTVSYMAGALDNAYMCISILLAVPVIYIVVNVMGYLFYKSEANMMTKKIQHIKQNQQEELEL